VACAGLLINIIGVLLFCGHGGHSHAGHNHDHKEHKGDYKKEKPAEKNHDDHDHKHDRGHDDEQGQTHNEQIDKALDDADVLMKKDVGRGATIQSVFLHVLGDALGSVAVIISALFIWLTEYPWRFYIDPAISYVATFLYIV
jgi:zinc transporter 1